MVDFTAIELGKILGSNIQKTEEYKQDFLPSDNIYDITLTDLNTIELSGSYIISANYYSSTSFVLDHPRYGQLDITTLKLTGTYLVGSTDIVQRNGAF